MAFKVHGVLTRYVNLIIEWIIVRARCIKAHASVEIVLFLRNAVRRKTGLQVEMRELMEDVVRLV